MSTTKISAAQTCLGRDNDFEPGQAEGEYQESQSLSKGIKYDPEPDWVLRHAYPVEPAAPVESAAERGYEEFQSLRKVNRPDPALEWLKHGIVGTRTNTGTDDDSSLASQQTQGLYEKD